MKITPPWWRDRSARTIRFGVAVARVRGEPHSRPVGPQPHSAAAGRLRCRRRRLEYRVPTDEEWTEFLGHFEKRKVSIGNCGRAFSTPCIHEHAPLTELTPVFGQVGALRWGCADSLPA
jgi:hypothetical protein